jgi:trafficking protein particle complex subunit 1
VYYQDWHRTRRPKPAVPGGILPAVSKAISPSTITGGTVDTPRNTLSPVSGVVVAVNDELAIGQQSQPPPSHSTGLSFDEEAKLVYGVVISLRNMIKKLSGR